MVRGHKRQQSLDRSQTQNDAQHIDDHEMMMMTMMMRGDETVAVPASEHLADAHRPHIFGDICCHLMFAVRFSFIFLMLTFYIALRLDLFCFVVSLNQNSQHFCIFKMNHTKTKTKKNTFYLVNFLQKHPSYIFFVN